ncbi:MAG: L-aspartate oxidase [Chloroflexi bacterium]|nr:L-aspartate oxidase [Chloroflexota bacterium]MYD16036.1 L-aspartate oxidase [Chloroflexota bacterium]MYJ01912.1 L-aspartate oxidase [Chloroflexota bacterium]
MRILVIGSGLAGINAALLASEFSEVTLLSKGPLDQTNTQRAQGGIAAAVAAMDDPRLHAEDTIRAGAGLCDPDAVETLTTDGPAAISRLIQLGVEFDRDADGAPALATEGAHSTPRVLHAGGDRTGVHIQSALVGRLAGRDIDVRTDVTVSDLIVEAGRCVGAIANGRETLLADAVLLATGGAGALYRTTTNPANATGDGMALAFQAGAAVRDPEFVQFHPTALVGANSAFLISEALRGEGAVLVDAVGERFLRGFHPDAELAPRSVVARAITETMRRDGADHVMLDISHLEADYLRRRFPGVYRGALDRGHDITAGPIPVAPAAHYHMGGVYTDVDGRTTVPGLYAAGECASTGAHGANRVASNSLLEAAVFSSRAINAIRGEPRAASPPGGEMRTVHWRLEGCAPSLESLQVTMNELVGISRNESALREALDRFDAWSSPPMGSYEPSLPLATLSARLIAEAALQRRESRGSHLRLDFPEEDAAWQRHSLWQLARE